MIQVHVYVRTCRFKSCFPHVEPLIFKGSKIFITTVLLPYYYRIFGPPSISVGGGFFGNIGAFDRLPHVTVWGIRKPSGLRKVSVRFIDFCSHAHAVDQLLHPVGTGLPHLVDDVAVLVQGECCGKMSHVLLEGLDIVASLETVHSEGVAEIVDPVVLQAGFLQDLLEFLPDGRLDVVVAVRMAENQIGEIPFVPERTGGEFLRCLDCLVMLQYIHHERRRENNSGLTVFQCAPVGFSASFFSLDGKLLLHMDNAVFKINAVPGEADQLSTAQAGEKIYEDGKLKFLNQDCL